ncbi:hypothetical protein BDN70DRAFT_937804 [Pholiota conissans]|uniref:Tc1-like transposase DDE domain-containing protein n=1 Tax=Pholiota conissans TaxID=109636 RepID=A0A9P5YP83_9AGAR|nr:hypothetical protein BDN70DRAFT_937804 [Pholiota conissans]
MNWLEDKKIRLLFHPPSSPDLNPIERVWHELKHILRTLPHPPQTVNQLRAAVLNAWENLPIDDINKHIYSMPDRIAAFEVCYIWYNS